MNVHSDSSEPAPSKIRAAQAKLGCSHFLRRELPTSCPEAEAQRGPDAWHAFISIRGLQKLTSVLSMEEPSERGRLQRKRRKLGRHHVDEAREEKNQAVALTSSHPVFNFLHLAFLILEHDLPILFPGSERPRNTFALIGAGGSFLVFKEERSMDDLIIPANQIRSLEDGIVLKRTRQHHEWLHPEMDSHSSRYMSIMSELQILVDLGVQAHENILDLHGLTWDFEPEDDGFSVWPVLGLESAHCSLRSLMLEYNESDAPLSTRIGYCYNVAEALSFLHSRGVVHCDVKLENVLVCVTHRSGSLAKLSDFGSALLDVNEDTFLPKGVAGTPPWNAPEYRKPLRGLEIFSVDVYSFGMLLWRFLSRSPTLENLERAEGKLKEKLIENIESMKMSKAMANLAVKELEQSYDPSDELLSMVDILKKTLSPFAEQRCNMADVCSLMSQWIEPTDEPDVALDESPPTQEQAKGPVLSSSSHDEPATSEGSAEPADHILPISSEVFYNDLEAFYERFEDESPLVKKQLVLSLMVCASDQHESASFSGHAAYHLALCWVNGFGVQRDYQQAWDWIVKSAQLHNPMAREQAYRLYQALFPTQALPPDIEASMHGWLKETVLLGSFEAAQDLYAMNPVLHEQAIKSWEKRFCDTSVEHRSRCTGLEGPNAINSPLIPLLQNQRGNEQIHEAAALGNIDLLGELLSRKVDPNSCNSKGETPLLCAIRANEPEAAMFLLEHGARVDPAVSGESPSHWLIAIRGPLMRKVAEKLVEQGADLEQQHTETENNDFTFDLYPHGTPLDWAVSKRCTAVVEILIALGADPFNECSQFSPFTRAISAHDWDIIHILSTSRHATKDKMCAMESTGHNFLFDAIYCYPLYQRLLLHGSDINQAAVKTITALVDAGCDPSCVDKDGSSVMHILAGYCDVEFIKMILMEFDFKKYINTKAGSLGRTPIHHALAAGNVEVLKLLVEYGADTYVETSGYNILHLLAGMEDEEVALCCLQALNPKSRCDLNAVVRLEGWSDGFTAFSIAVHSSHLKIAECLVASGAEIAAGNSRDWHFVALLIGQPTWNSLHSLQYYLEKVDVPFIVREATSHSVLHVAASMMGYLADKITGEQKLNILLSRFSQENQVNAITKPTHDPANAGRQTPLHFAAKFGVFYAARKLLDAGANPNAKDECNDTPLDVARKQLDHFKTVTTEHEIFHIIEELKSTISLLEQPYTFKPESTVYTKTDEPSMQTRFSMLGFQTQPSSSGE